jgi:hypothetical protein
MRRPTALLVLALAAPASGTDGIAHRESEAEVGAALRGLRAAPRSRRAQPAAALPERVYVVVATLTAERRAALEAAGLVIEVPAPGAPAPPWHDGEVVQGLATPDVRRAVTALPFVVRVEAPGLPWRNAGSTVTAGEGIHLGAAARAVLDTTGEGVVVGVISDGVDDRAASVTSGDLPPDVELPAIAGLVSGQGDEGTALLEIVHDLAPGARLLFAAPRTSAEMVLAIEGLAAAGADVIVDDLVFTDEPKFEDGPIALAARRFAAADGLYVTAAGNFARSHYIAPYRPSAGTSLGGAEYRALHAFGPGDSGDTLRIPPGADLLAVLQWNEPFGRAASDFDLVLAESRNRDHQVLAAGAAVQDGTGEPLESLHFVNRGASALRAYLAIAEYGGVTDPERVELNLHVFSRALVAQEYTVPHDSVFGHAAVEEVLSVAAADAARPAVVEDFSSRGPATIVFPTRAARQVPRLTAVDGIQTAVGRRGAFVNPFYGTSAAAPHAAGCAALLLAARVPPADAAAAMLATARDLLPAGVDGASGAGMLDCEAAARLSTGSATVPAVGAVAAGFDATAGVMISAGGTDPEGDVRTATLRLLDRHGEEILRRPAEVALGGAAFTVTALLRGAELARARGATVSVRDATGLTSPEAGAAFGCPGDGSLGDTLCGVGDVLDRLGSTPLARPARLERPADAAAAALARAGAATAAGQARRARRAVGAALGHLGRLRRRLARAALAPFLQATIDAQRQALRRQLRAPR